MNFKIGQTVRFKSDIEQRGTIVEIENRDGNLLLTLEAKDRFAGDYIGGMKRTQIFADEAF
jgi:hypothetical protein